MHYHNFNELNMHYYTFSLSLAWLGGYFQRVTTHYRQIYKKMFINIFKKN